MFKKFILLVFIIITLFVPTSQDQNKIIVDTKIENPKEDQMEKSQQQNFHTYYNSKIVFSEER